MRTIVFLAVAALGFGEEFEVAAIKPAAPSKEIGRTSSSSSTDTGAGQLAFTNVAMKDIVRLAYGVQSYQISGPGWMETERFDVMAKFAPQSTGEQVKIMLQKMLQDRFRMVMHRETKELPAYVLTAIGPKLKALTDSGGNVSSSSSKTGVHLDAKTTMRGFAEYLSQRLDRPVLDQTGLAGGFEFQLDWEIDDAADANGAVLGPSVFTAVQEQLGLKLTATKGPVETIVVESIQKVPTEN